MARKRIPERITHNDTKFNNVMLDVLTGEAMCIVDLDTVMPGCAHYDFGDMVRTTTSPTLEDEGFIQGPHANAHVQETRPRLSLDGRTISDQGGKILHRLLRKAHHF